MMTVGKVFLYNILTAIALSSFCSATSDPRGIPIKYSSPICTSTGGNTTLECDGSYAVYDIFIGRDSEGACGWTESSQLGCSVDFTCSEEVLEMMNIVYNRVRVCGAATCEINGINPISTSCGNDTIIRIAYFCYTDSLLIEKEATNTDVSGCDVISGEDGNVFSCPDANHQVNLLDLKFQYLRSPTPTSKTNETCERNDSFCEIDMEKDSDVIYIQEECSKHQKCPISALASSSGSLYGCRASSYNVTDIDVVKFSYQFLCQNPANFTVGTYILPRAHNCIGMPNGLHAVIFDGRFDYSPCFQNYTTCRNGNVEAIEACDVGQGFHEGAKQCEDLNGTFCSIKAPELFTAALSDTEGRLSWTTTHTTPDFYVIRARDEKELNEEKEIHLIAITEYTFSNLEPNTNYTFSIAGVVNRIEGESRTVWNVTYPETPTGTLKSLNSTAAQLSWSFNHSASFVLAELISVHSNGSKSSMEKWKILVTDGQDVKFIGNLVTGNYYVMTLTLEGFTGLTSLEDYKIEYRAKPASPENFTIEDSETSIKFFWSQPGDSDGWIYNVTLGMTSSGFIGNNVAELVLDGLEAGTLYRVEIRNVVDGAESEAVLVEESTFPFPPDNNLALGNYGNYRYQIPPVWYYVQFYHRYGHYDYFTGYLVKLNNTTPLIAGIIITSPDLDSEELIFKAPFNDIEAEYGYSYKFTLYTVAHGKRSDPDIYVFTMPPLYPETLKVLDFDTHSAELQWSLVPQSLVHFYELQWSIDEVTVGAERFSNSTTSAVVSNLQPGATVTFEIKSFVWNGYGTIRTVSDYLANYVTNSTQTLRPLPPLNLRVEYYDNETLTITWDSPENSSVSGFEVTFDEMTDTIQAKSMSNNKTWQHLVPGTLKEVNVTTFVYGPDSNQTSSVATITQRLKPNPPSNVQIVSTLYASATIAFEAPQNAEYSGFKVQVTSLADGALVYGKVVPRTVNGSYLVNIQGFVYGHYLLISVSSLSGEEDSESATVNLLPAPSTFVRIIGFVTDKFNFSLNPLISSYLNANLSILRLDIEENESTRNFSVGDSVFNFGGLDLGVPYVVEPWFLDDFSYIKFSEDKILPTDSPVTLDLILADAKTIILKYHQFENNQIFQIISGSDSKKVLGLFDKLANLLPATNYTFLTLISVEEQNSEGDPYLVTAESVALLGYTYPDNMENLSCSASASSESDVNINVQWNFPRTNFSSFDFTFTTTISSNEEVLRKKVSLAKSLFGDVDNSFDYELNQTDIEWLAPGLYIQCSGAATYLEVESQSDTGNHFYIPLVAPTLTSVTTLRSEYSFTIQWSFHNERTFAESFHIGFQDTEIAYNENLFLPQRNIFTSFFNLTLIGLTPGQRYVGRVRSYIIDSNNYMLSEWSSPLYESTYPLAPLNPLINNWHLSWAKLGVVEGYQVNVTDDFGSTDSLSITDSIYGRNVSLDDFNNLNFVPGGKYTFDIFSISNDLYSLTTARVEHILPPSNVVFTRIEEIWASEVTLSWKIPDGNVEKYVILIIPLTSGKNQEDSFSIEVVGKSSNTTRVASLTPGSKYMFEIVASSNNVSSLESGKLFTERQPLLSTIEVHSVEETKASCSWDFVGIVDNFTVSLRDTESQSIAVSVSNITDVTILSVEFKNLTAGETYSCYVVAASGSRESDPKSATLTTYPAAPAAISILHFDTENVQLEWSSVDNYSNADAYVILWSDSTGSKQQIVAASNTSTNISNLHPGRTYTFEIKTAVFDHDKNYVLSVSESRETKKIQTLMPLQPEFIQTIIFTSEIFSFSWNEPAGSDFTGFEVTHNEKTEFVGNVTVKTMTNLIAGTLQRVTVRTVSRGNDSTQLSLPVFLEQQLKPLPPTNFKVLSRSMNSTVISFEGPSGEYSEFLLQAVSSTGDVLANRTIAQSEDSPYNETIHTELVGDQINVTVLTIAGAQRIGASVQETINLFPANPVGFEGKEFSTTTLKVTWDTPPGIFGGHKLVLRRLGINEKEFTTEKAPEINDHTFEFLVPGVEYEIEIWTCSAYDTSLLSNNSEKISQVTKPNAPYNIQFEPINKTSVKLIWSHNGLFDIFEVTYDSKSIISEQNSTEIDDLSPATNYTFHIVSVVSNDIDHPIKSDTLTTGAYTYPEDVSGLQCVSSSSPDGSITVVAEWKFVSTAYDSFKFIFTSVNSREQNIHNKTVSLTRIDEGVSSPFAHEFNVSDIEGLFPGYKMRCSVVAVYLNLESQVEAVKDFYAQPIAPILTFTDSRNTTSLTFSWHFVIKNALADSFEIEYSVQPKPENVLAQSEESKSSTEIFSGLQPGQLYTFRIRSFVGNSTQSSDWSESVVQATYPEVPLNPVINYSYVSWSAPQDGFAEAYQIHVNDSFQNSDGINTTDSSQTKVSFTDFINLSFVAGRRYTFNIFSLSNNLYSLASADIEFVLPPNDVNFKNVYETSTSSVSLTWQVPDGDVEKYIITIIPLNANDLLEQFSIEVPDRPSDFKEITDLTPGAEYEFLIVASSNSEFSENSGQINFQIQPLLSAVQISSFSETSASCSWSFIGIVDNFTISLRDHESSTVAGSVSEIAAISVLSHEFADLTAGETYSCYVVAASGNRESDPKLAAFTTYPFSPEVDVTFLGTNSFSANWSVQTERIKFDSFRAFLTECQKEPFNETFNLTVFSYIWVNLIPGSLCQLTIWTISETVASRNGSSVTQRLYPDNPIMDVVRTNSTAIEIKWTVEGVTTGFILKVSRDDFEMNLTFDGATRQTIVHDLEVFTAYNLTLFSKSGTRRSLTPAFLQISTTKHAHVTNAAVRSLSGTELMISWQLSDVTATKFSLHLARISEESNTELWNRPLMNETSYKDSGLTPATKYTYKIWYNLDGIPNEPVIIFGFTRPIIIMNKIAALFPTVTAENIELNKKVQI